MTNEAKEIMLNGLGYRDESCYGLGYEEFEEVFEFEVFELCNTDIFLTIRDEYGIKFDMRKKKEAINIILSHLRNHFKSRDLFCIWVCTKSTVHYYGTEDISEVIIPKNSIMVSDLGDEGVLFVNSEPFERR